jgi:uncharacterized membrane protein
MEKKISNPEPTKSAWAAALVGIGLMAGMDEIAFHQILAWHHFYDLATSEIGLMSDGLLHAAELIAIVAGFFMLLDLRRDRALVVPRAWAGFFLGMGGFQLFDGIFIHKVLRLHQIRYVENILPYDLSWNIFALVLLIIGWMLLRRAKDKEKVSLQPLNP